MSIQIVRRTRTCPIQISFQLARNGYSVHSQRNKMFQSRMPLDKETGCRSPANEQLLTGIQACMISDELLFDPWRREQMRAKAKGIVRFKIVVCVMLI